MDPKYERSFKSRHLFKLNQDFLCEEVLYVSSSKHESGYKVAHKQNKGKCQTESTIQFVLIVKC